MHDIVVLFDVDNTLLDNDRVTQDLHDYLDREVGVEQATEYFALFEELRQELGYADYLGALQRYRNEIDHGGDGDHRLLQVSNFLIDYPFAERL